MQHGKACTRCQRTLPAECYRRVAAMRDGLDSWCKDCKRQAVREWRARNRRKPKRAAQCDHCGVEFTTARHDQRYCSPRCCRKHWNTKARNHKAIACLACGVDFVPSDYRATHCSVACAKTKPCCYCGRRKPKINRHARHCADCHTAHRRAQRRAQRHAEASAKLGRTIGRARHWYAGVCIQCGEAFVDNQPARNFCSRPCQNRHGKSTRRARKAKAYVEVVVRPKVYERDRWTCQLCLKLVDRTRAVPHPLAPTLDHVVPLAAGGDHSYANVQLAHFRCNYLKGDRGGGEQLRLVG